MRDQQLPPSGDPPEPPTELDPRRLRTTGAPALAGAAVPGLVLGWLLRPASVWLDVAPPRPGAVQVGLLVLAAAILGWVAWATHQALHRQRVTIPAHQAVNRLVLAKSCAVAGAFLLGGHLGYALSWAGLEAEVAGERIVAGLLGAGASLLVLVTALLLERACRVRRPDGEP